MQLKWVSKLFRIVEALKQHIKLERHMQTMASKSPLGWSLVKRIKDNPDYEKSDLGINGKDVRTWEKELVSYNSKSTLFLSPYVQPCSLLIYIHRGHAHHH